MAKASSLSIDKNNSFLFKGSPGFGKTLAAASFAIDGPVFLAYWDKKKPVELLTYFTEARFGPKAKTILDNIEYEVYDASNPNEFLNKMVDFVTDCRYFAIICDSITVMTSSCVNWSLNFGNGAKEKKKIKDILPEWDEYKVETSLVSQCIDLGKKLPTNIIWTAHPLSSVSLTGTGQSMKVVRTNPIVSYGSKVASMVPGSFTEIYHFSQTSSFSSEGSSKKYIVNTEAIGDEFAKSPILGSYVKEFDITDKLFYEVWKDLVNKSQGKETKEEIGDDRPKLNNPFSGENTPKW